MTKAPRVRCADLFDPVVLRKWWREHTGSHAATTSNHKYGTGSCTGSAGTGSTLTWSSSNADLCSASGTWSDLGWGNFERQWVLWQPHSTFLCRHGASPWCKLQL